MVSGQILEKMLQITNNMFLSEGVGLVALVAERKGDEVVGADPILVEEVSRLHEDSCQEEEASRNQVVVAFHREIHGLVA